MRKFVNAREALLNTNVVGGGQGAESVLQSDFTSMTVDLSTTLTSLDDGRKICTGEYEALKALAEINGKRLPKLLSKVFINENGFVERAYFDNLHLKDITPVSRIKYIKELALNSNEIEDITPLSALTELEDLDLRRNGISDISTLVGLPSLKYLEVPEKSLSANSKLIMNRLCEYVICWSRKPEL